LNIIEYLFCERLFGKVLLIEKIVVGKVWQKKCGRKITTEKSAIEKSWQKHGWGLFMRDMTHPFLGMFCDIGFIS
jgi:hypothetical protein